MAFVDQLRPGLSTALKCLSKSELRELAVVAIQSVKASLPTQDDRTNDILASFLAGSTISPTDAAYLQEASQVSDERYFTQQENGEPETIWMASFNLALLQSALHYLALHQFADDPAEQIGHFLSDLACAVDEDRQLRHAICQFPPVSVELQVETPHPTLPYATPSQMTRPMSPLARRLWVTVTICGWVGITVGLGILIFAVFRLFSLAYDVVTGSSPVSDLAAILVPLAFLVMGLSILSGSSKMLRAHRRAMSPKR
jgi:hypothetical protein